MRMAARSSPFRLPCLEVLENRLLLAAAQPVNPVPVTPPAAGVVATANLVTLSMAHSSRPDQGTFDDDGSSEDHDHDRHLVVMAVASTPAVGTAPTTPIESTVSFFAPRNNGIPPEWTSAAPSLPLDIDPAPLLHVASSDEGAERLPPMIPPAISPPADAGIREVAIASTEPAAASEESAAALVPEAARSLARLLPVNLRQLAENVDALFAQLGQLTGHLPMAADGIALAPWIIITAAIALELALLPQRNEPDHQELSDAIALRLGEAG